MGKLRFLGLILREHHEALEFSLLNLPTAVDLLDLYRGLLSLRRLWLLITHLPLDSALARSLDPDGAQIATWGPSEYILADLYDLTMQAAGGRDVYPRPTRELFEKRRADKDKTDLGRRRLVERYEARQKAKRRG